MWAVVTCGQVVDLFITYNYSCRFTYSLELLWKSIIMDIHISQKPKLDSIFRWSKMFVFVYICRCSELLYIQCEYIVQQNYGGHSTDHQAIRERKVSTNYWELRDEEHTEQGWESCADLQFLSPVINYNESHIKSVRWF